MDPKVFVIPAKQDKIVKNVGIYCRVSTSEKDQLNSLSAQISALTRAVSHVEQWKLRDTFIDIGSAKPEVLRKEFERMLHECEAHNISVILTKSISRFGRDTVDTLEALRRLKAAGTRVIFEQENLDTDNTDSNLMISVIESFAQAENETRSDNIRMGLNFRAAQGTSGLYRRRLYGYDKTAEGELGLNKEQAQVVRDIFRWYNNGKSVLGIIKQLAAPGHTPGHISLLMEKDSIVIKGDAMALEDGLPVIVNPQFALNLEQAATSMEKLLALKAKTYYCYHGGVYSLTDSEDLK